MAIHYELVHPARTQGGTNCIHHRLTGIDVANYLGPPLTAVSTILEKNDGSLLEREREEKEKGRERGGRKEGAKGIVQTYKMEWNTRAQTRQGIEQCCLIKRGYYRQCCFSLLNKTTSTLHHIHLKQKNECHSLCRLFVHSLNAGSQYTQVNARQATQCNGRWHLNKANFYSSFA